MIVRGRILTCREKSPILSWPTPAQQEAAKVSEEPEADEFEIEEDLFNEEINDDFVEDAENTEEAVEDFDAEDIEE